MTIQTYGFSLHCIPEEPSSFVFALRDTTIWSVRKPCPLRELAVILWPRKRLGSAWIDTSPRALPPHQTPIKSLPIRLSQSNTHRNASQCPSQPPRCEPWQATPTQSIRLRMGHCSGPASGARSFLASLHTKRFPDRSVRLERMCHCSARSSAAPLHAVRSVKSKTSDGGKSSILTVVPIIAHAQQFGLLQSKLFPVYFSFSSYISTFLLGHWLYRHPGTLSAMFGRQSINTQTVRASSVTNAWILAVGYLGTSLLNLLVVTPLASKIMFKRHRLEREEKKSYTDPDASDELRAISKQFGLVHSVSSILVSAAYLSGSKHRGRNMPLLMSSARTSVQRLYLRICTTHLVPSSSPRYRTWSSSAVSCTTVHGWLRLASRQCNNRARRITLMSHTQVTLEAEA